MVVVTGAYGFIGSCWVGFLNQKGITDIIAVDDFSKKAKEPNLKDKTVAQRIERDVFLDWFDKNHPSVSFVFHLGARTDTTEFDWAVFQKLNLDYSKYLFLLCQKYSKPMVYASSAATYGNGEQGYSDNDPSVIEALKPLNPYGDSKNMFDIWLKQMIESKDVLQKKSFFAHTDLTDFPFWAGLKFFNVYGPNEYHKGRMASTIFHFFNQIKEKGEVSLFKSHRPDFKDGEQMRDFVYVKDVLKVLWFFYENYKKAPSGIYNLGTGKARSFNDLVKNVFENLEKPTRINYVSTPEDIRDKYQYFTEADMSKFRDVQEACLGENKDFENFSDLEHGIADYVKNYLIPNKYF